MAGFFYKGILLQQLKEPALSRDLREFFNADTIGIQMDSPPVPSPEDLSHGEIITLARTANIIDERDGKLLADKLLQARRKNPHIVVADAIDDEPYISSQLNPVLKNPQLAADGLTLCQRACGADLAAFAVYKNLTDLDIRIPQRIGAFPVERIHGRYPAEYQASKSYAEDEGILVLGAGAVLHLARAVLFSKPQTTAFITVAGNCVGNPTNLEVSLGMTVAQVLERCGLIDDPNRVVVGGSMTGISVIDTENTLITPTTRAILAFRQDIRNRNFSCIGCSRCVQVCPRGLSPYHLYKAITEHRYDLFSQLDPELCIGCGTCSYMCPAKLDLSHTIHTAAVEFTPVVKAMDSHRERLKRAKEAEYNAYYCNFRLGKATAAHRRAVRRVLRERRQALREAQNERDRANRASDQMLEAARRTMQRAQTDADRALAAAEQAQKRTQAAAQAEFHGAENERDRLCREADRELALAEKAMQAEKTAALSRVDSLGKEQEKAGRDADKALKDARDAIDSTVKAAEKAMEQALRQQEKEGQAALREAERALELLAKQKKDQPPATPEEIKAASDRCETLRAHLHRNAEELKKRELERVEKVRRDAREAYEREEARRKQQGQSDKISLAQAEEDRKQAESRAEQAYAQARERCAQEKERAEELVKAAQEARNKTYEAAKGNYVEAEKLSAKQKAEAREAFAAEEASHEMRRQEQKEIFEEKAAEAERESYAKRRDLDDLLAQIYKHAMEAARAAAEKSASVTGARPALKDFSLPTHALRCRRELLEKSCRAPDDPVLSPKAPPAEKLMEREVRELLRPWGIFPAEKQTEGGSES